MKKITAYIKTEKLDDVASALHEIEDITGVSVSDVRGFGRGRSKKTIAGRMERTFGFLPRIRLEIVCRDETVDRIVSVIEANGRTGLRGDGKIFVENIEQAVRIGSGERGEKAI